MTADHDQLRELLGAYVLGGLASEDRARLETHLRGCAGCRAELAGYAGLPGLLRMAGPAGGWAEGEAAAGAADEAVLARTLDAARSARSRQNHRVMVLSAAAAVALLFLGALGAVLATRGTSGTSAPDGRSGIPLVAAAGSDAHGQIQLDDRPWGTAVTLDLSALPSGQRCVAWVVAEGGTRQQAGTWASTPDGHAVVTGASAFAREQVASVRVTTTDGTLLLSADV